MAFFLLGMSPGCYTSALTNLINAQGLGSEWVTRAFLAGPIAAMVSPLMIGALADNRFAAQKVSGWIMILSSLLLAAAFRVLQAGGNPWGFVILLGGSSILVAPMWGMMTSISMTHLRCSEREFPLVRLGGTLGWMLAGWLVSYVLLADRSPIAGYAGAAVRMVAGISAFFLPRTPPVGSSRSLRTLLGLDAFKLLRERDQRMFFLVTALLSMPLMAFYIHTPKHLQMLGATKAAAVMTIGQFSEIAAMLAMSSIGRRFRVKTLLMAALGLSALRYGLFAMGGAQQQTGWLVAGIALHGMCYTFYFITGQLFLDRRVEPGMRTQAQGLLSLVNNGLGSLVGVKLGQWLYDLTVAGGHGGWTAYWLVQMGCILLCVPVLGVFYRGVGTSKEK